jgi:hypothetical protein
VYIGAKAENAKAAETIWQDMQQETADELPPGAVIALGLCGYQQSFERTRTCSAPD